MLRKRYIVCGSWFLACLALAKPCCPTSYAAVAIGFITPPYGLNLYVASGVTGVPYFRLLRYIIPYLIALISVWFFVALVPETALMILPDR